MKQWMLGMAVLRESRAQLLDFLVKKGVLTPQEAARLTPWVRLGLGQLRNFSCV